MSKESGVDDQERRYGLTAVWTDLDNHGKLDLFVTRRPGELSLQGRRQGKGVFSSELPEHRIKLQQCGKLRQGLKDCEQ